MEIFFLLFYWVVDEIGAVYIEVKIYWKIFKENVFFSNLIFPLHFPPFNDFQIIHKLPQ
jgi:hypothetical protein